ncbi:MAG: ABC transporter ATP-binding protein [Rhizobiaceae bacterium]|nr:ABC transporter ATP-binding protein [Rhizobiaceae bacterium]
MNDLLGPPALKISNLNVSYGPISAVNSLGLVVQPAEAVAVIGSNGAGKTTLLKAIMNLVPSITNSSVEFFGQQISNKPAHTLARMGIGYVPEGRELFAGLSILEELQIGTRFASPADQNARMEEAFTLFPRLKERRKQITSTLSGGEQQMLAIARIVVMKPRLLLLDEPSLGLAPVIQDIVYETLAGLRDRGLPILLVEQNAYRALKLCRRAYVIELGKVTREAPSAELLNDPSIQSAYLGS